ncbi:MAG: class I mannose-6-phosphate isomerase [Bacteroides sp.]|nr:class I mannose-6-phosphate isomerase [Eubacterium sp.]MCM1418753.1 class I mannose-6-phosphate isomerase [Roseburia sp.]MCM1461998.1 class I mannose-6-phosphate isomerase [Bacteroides sp.]
MEILKLNAPCKDYLWGGTRLRDEYGKKSEKDKIAESWELSCHKDGQSVIANGAYAGKTLSEYIEQNGRDVLGRNAAKFEYFPILIKLIDAKDNLSVQVHPENDYALRVEGEYGKTEMWYIVDCDPGAELLYGFKKEITRDEFARRIRENTLLEVTNNVPVHKGDVFFIEAGTLHAIGKGILIAEIQQNSNTTYRIYDYGRVGADGKPRELHIEKACEVTKLTPPTRPTKPAGEPIQKEGYTETLLASCEYFTVKRLDITEKAALVADESSFLSLLVLDGAFTVGDLTLGKGESAFVPANYGAFTLSGSGEVILSGV